MKFSLLLRASCALIAGGFAAIQAQAVPTAKITFNYTGGVVDSITIDEALIFDINTTFSGSAVQIRIFDVYPTDASTTVTGAYPGFDVDINSTAVLPLTTNISQFAGTLGGSATAGDLLLAFSSSGGNFSVISGDTLSLEGTATASSTKIAVPTTGTYQAYLRGGSGNIALPITVEVVGISAIPEPSTYAAIFGGVMLVGATVVRRRKLV